MKSPSLPSFPFVQSLSVRSAVRFLKIAGGVAAVFGAEGAPDTVGAAGAGIGGGGDGGQVAGVDIVADKSYAAISHGDLNTAWVFTRRRPDAGEEVSGN